MAKFLDRLRFLLRNRRKAQKPVDDDRRGGGGGSKMRQAEDRLKAALDDFEKTVRINRNDFVSLTANDAQATVQFSTFSEICKDKVLIGRVRYCRHKLNLQVENTVMPICEEKSCPFAQGLVKSAA